MRYARIVQYELRPRSIEFAIRNARAGLLPIFRQLPGFVSYQVVKTGEASVISVSLWESKAAAENANRAAVDWLKQNLPETIISSKSIIAEVVLDSAADVQSPEPAALHS